MARIRINIRAHTKEKPYLINSYFFSKLVRQKRSIGWAKYVYVCVWDMCWRNFCNFPWWLENVKSRSKIALFSNERHFEIWFPEKRTITFFWSKLSKLHKKDLTLHVATIFSLKQGETRPGGALNFFSGRDVRPGFLKCGACELTFASENFPKLEACELKISKFRGLWAENFQIWGLVS